MLSDAQEIGPFFDKEEATFDAIPEVAGTITLADLKCDLLTWDGSQVLKTLTIGGGIVNNTTYIRCTFATDALDVNNNPLFPPGRYQFQIRLTTVGARRVVAQGPFEVQTLDT